MSKMMRSSTSGKPPLCAAVRSPIRLRSRRLPQPTPTTNAAPRTPPGSLVKSQLPNRTSGVEKSQLRPEYHTISCELRALTKMVHQELGKEEEDNLLDIAGGQRSPLFERGRFYDEYCARRNERLKRKNGQMEGYDKKPVYDLGVRVESAKKRETTKFASRRKTTLVAATPVAERREAPTPRYSLRSSSTISKENKKPPPLPMMMSFEKSVGVTERKTGNRRVRKI